MNNIKHKKLTILAFTLPALLVYAVFTVGPMVPSIVYSFFEYKALKIGDFVGLENYIKVLKDPIFHTAMKNTFKLVGIQFVIGMPLSVICAFLIAVAGPKVRRFFKTLSFIPSVLSVSAVCALWYMMLQPDFGPIGAIMRLLGLGDYVKPWLSSADTAFNTVSLTYIWQFIGYNMVLFYSGIKAIPESYFDAARIDGANLFQQVVYIAIPLLQETFKFVFILMVSGCMAMMANVQVLTQNGVGGAAYTSAFYIFRTAFNKLNFGQAFAATVIYSIVSFATIRIVNLLVARNRTEYT